MGKLKATTCPGCKKHIGRHDAVRWEQQVKPKSTIVVFAWQKPIRVIWHLACAQKASLVGG